MDVELKTRWLEALRSGKFKQGRELLHDAWDDTYCCLGVLCEIDEKVARDRLDDNQYIFPDGDESPFLLSDEYHELIGLSVKDANKLVDMNDSGDYNFEDIADYIEKDL